MMKTLNKLIGAICFSVALCGGAQANLIDNGSFEDVGGDPFASGTWGYYSSIPEWTSPNNIEIWDTPFLGVTAVDGDRVAELNAHPVGEFSIFQSFDTIIGDLYDLTFFAQKRNNNLEMFNVSVVDVDVDISSHINNAWIEYNYTFEAVSTTSTLTFTSLDGANDTTGNLLDAISVMARPTTTNVPEPSILMLILLGLTGLIVTRRKTDF